MMLTQNNAPSIDATDRAQLPGLGYRLLQRDPGGAWSLGVHDLAPRALGAPTHVHEREDEHSYVVSGRLRAQIRDAVAEAGPGELVSRPRGIPHAFWNPGDEPVVFLELISPAGFEQYFFEAGPILTAAQPDIPALMAIMERYAMSMDPSSAQALVEAHGLAPVPLGAAQPAAARLSASRRSAPRVTMCAWASPAPSTTSFRATSRMACPR